MNTLWGTSVIGAHSNSKRQTNISMKFLSLFAFALLLFACNSQNTSTAEDDRLTDETTTAAPDRMDDPMADGMDTDMAAGSQQLQSTVDAVNSAGGDITALDPSTATSNIDGWIGQLRGMDGTDGIVSELENLKTELSAESIDGSRVSTILSTLADETRNLEGQAPGLGTLASALQAGADKLAGK